MANTALTKWFTHTCDLITYTAVRNSIGEMVKTEGTISTAVPCRYIQRAGQFVNQQRTEQFNRNDKVLFPGSVSAAVFTRIANVQDEDGNVLIADSLEVILPNKRNDLRGSRLLSVEVSRVGHGERT